MILRQETASRYWAAAMFMCMLLCTRMFMCKWCVNDLFFGLSWASAFSDSAPLVRLSSWLCVFRFRHFATTTKLVRDPFGARH